MAEGIFSFTEHLNELRSRLRIVVIFLLVVLVVVVFAPANPIQQLSHPEQYLNLQFLANTVIASFLGRIRADLLPRGWGLIPANGLGEGMEVYFVASLLVTVAVGMPIIAYEVYKFVDPALKKEEKGMVYPFVASTTILFVVGIAFGYFVIARFLLVALAPFMQATGLNPASLDGASFYYVIFLIIGSTGASFTAPVFVYAVIRLGVLEADFFSRNRVVIWFVIWVVTGLFLTPDGGPLLDLVLFLPIVTMIEIAVWLGRRNTRGKGRIAPPSLVLCRYCSTELPKGRQFCTNCGRFNTASAGPGSP